MQISRSTFLVFVVVVIVMTLSVTVFKDGGHSAVSQFRFQKTAQNPYEDRRDRYPTVESDDVEITDPLKRAKLKRQKKLFDKDAPFTNPGPKDEEVAFRPEAQFDFPALPVAKSDVIVIGQVLEAEAHRSENKMNVFSNFQLRVDEVVKGNNLTVGSLITIGRIGGFVKYPSGRKVLFRLSGNGMPGIGARYAFFLNASDEDFSILTAYELGVEGVVPLDNSPQFKVYEGESEAGFVKALRNAISQAVPQQE